MFPQYMPLVWTTSVSRSAVVDLHKIKAGVLLVPATWNGSAVLDVYVYDQAVANAPADPVPKATGSGSLLYSDGGTKIQVTVPVGSAGAICLPPEVFQARFVAFNSSSAPTAGLSWSIDAKPEL